MTKREQEILDLIKFNPLISQNELAEQLNITRSSVGVHIANLTKKGLIKGRGYVLSSDYVVVIGASNVDIFGDGDSIVMHDSNIGHISTSLGGVGRNIAENIGLLGQEVKLISIVGDDIYGKKILEETTNVDMTNVTVANATTGVYLSVGSEMLLAINDMKINDTMTSFVIEKYDALIKHARIIIMDTNFPVELIEHITRRYSDKQIILDAVSGVKALKVKDIIGSFHTIKPNKMEAEILSGIKIKTNDDLQNVAEYFHNRGVIDVFVTLGSEGVYYSSNGESGIIAAEKIDVVNATGAGDAFVAGLVYGYMNDYNIKDIARVAMNCSKHALLSEETINKKLCKELIEVK